ncbi:MAG TPA: alpha/beta fold hydrolase [Candidatus Acidoferrum sp.]|nr:alpha/beta fold hydrolase [Candidatus Acidoferrum sp.]
MRLHFKHHPGAGPTVVVLHGLYGNQGNWSPLCRQLAQDFNVYALDARNHGQSAWADTMTLAEMADDVVDTLQLLGIATAHLIGHSMGGKTAMLLALRRPELVQSLCVVDIAPVAYAQAADGVIQALVALDLAQVASRADADHRLAEKIPEKFVRDFLLTNLQRDENGGWRWRFNLPVLAASFREVTGWPDDAGSYAGPTLFIKGEHSHYILPEHRAAIVRQFPHAQFKIVNGAGHWVHSEKPEAVLRLIRNFLTT